MTNPLLLSPHPLRDRLWLGGLGVALFLVTMIVASHLAGPNTSLVGRPMGDDFLPSYMAGTFVREGRIDKLMDVPAAARFQADVRRAAGLEQHGRFGPWLNPPFYAWVFVPLSAMDYRPALWTWAGLNGAMLVASLVLLARMLPRDATGAIGWRTWGLVPLLVCCSMPFLQALASQQNTFLSLLLLTATVTLWRAERALAAGLVAGLLLFKPQLALVLTAVLVLSLGRRAFLGLAITGTALLLVTLLTMPGALGDYLHKLPAALPWLQPGRPYPWGRQMTFQGFWRLVFQGSVTGPAPLAARVIWPLCALAVGAWLARTAWRSTRRETTPLSRDRLIAATVAAMPLLMPYYMDYDLLLLAVPASLLAGELTVRSPGTPLQRADRWLVGAWVALVPLLFLSATIAFETRVHLAVPLLTVIVCGHVARTGRRSAIDEPTGVATCDVPSPNAPFRHAA